MNLRQTQSYTRWFAAGEGDLISYLNVWRGWEASGRAKKWAIGNSVNHRTMLRAADIRMQLQHYVRRLGLTQGTAGRDITSVRKALAAGGCSCVLGGGWVSEWGVCNIVRGQRPECSCSGMFGGWAWSTAARAGHPFRAVASGGGVGNAWHHFFPAHFAQPGMTAVLGTFVPVILLGGETVPMCMPPGCAELHE